MLPTDRLAEFLDGRRVQRSGVLPTDRGVVVALGGQPIELVLASDIDVRFLQATLEPRYVLRVFERLVLRIKELDAVCCVTTDGAGWIPEVIARRSTAMTAALPALLERAGIPAAHPGRSSPTPPPAVMVGTPTAHPVDLVQVLMRRGGGQPLVIRAAARRREPGRSGAVVPRATARARAGPRG